MAEYDDCFNARLDLAMKSIVAKGAPPARILAIHLGEASAHGLEGFLAKARPATLALYLHKGDSGAFSSRERHEAALHGTVLERFETSGFMRERIFSAIEASHAANISLSSSSEIPQDILRWLQAAAVDGFEKRNNRMRTTQTRLRCTLANLPRIASAGRMKLPSFDPYDPVIICGAGPSLAGQLAQIAQAQRNAIVICAGRSAKMLAEAGIQPDYVVDVEQNAQLYWQEGMRFKGSLVAHESISPVVAASFPRFIWTDSGLNPLRSLMAVAGIELPSIPANGPVASVMTGFAIASGARLIALCGYDLSLGAGGKAYADGQGLLDKGAAKGIETPSTDGKAVETLPHFEAMRRDIEGSIDILRRSGLVFELFNCCPSGAMIAGARPMPLDAFISSFAKERKSISTDLVPPTGKLPTALCYELSKAGKAREAVERLVKHISRIAESLSEEAPDLKAIRAAEPQLELLFKDEAEERKTSELSAAAFAQASLLSEQWPVARPRSELEARRGLFRNMQRQSRLHLGLLDDAMDDARKALKALEQQGQAAAIDVHAHPALRAHAIRIIREENPELAEMLASLQPGHKARGFETLSKLFSPPIVLSMSAPGGSTLTLCEQSSYADEVKAGAESILKQSAFDPELDAIILCGHVNWGLATEIAFRHPGAKMAVIYPWLELLSQMADSCEFAGLLPAGTLLLCPGTACVRWKESLACRLKLWRGSVRRMLLFENQATSSLPECVAASQAVKELLNQP